jgi:hypothetical protein
LNTKQKLRRLGCGVALVLWFTFLLTPCLIFVLAVQGEIVLTHSDLPEHHFRIWSIQTTRLRGLGITTARRVDPKELLACTISDTRFIMWQGEAAPAHQCSCYEKQQNLWMSVAEGTEACKLAGE